MEKSLLLFVLLSVAVVRAASRLPIENYDDSLEQDASLSAQRHISQEIVDDLVEIADLIPKAAIDVVVAKHYMFDADFRKALDFLKSSKFTAMLDKLQGEPEIVELLDYLQILLPTAVESDPLDVPYLEIVLLEAMAAREQRPRLTKRSVANERLTDVVEPTNLHSFIYAVRELLNYLPHDKYKNLINEKKRKSELFANFYKALRSSQFRPKVEAALASKNLVTYIATLNSHSIDVRALVPIAFTVISWGPDV